MDKLTFYIVDVFAESKYAGNQLAVFRGSAGLSQAEMQAIAKEMNYSETTFIVSDEPCSGEGATAGGWDVRIFTPEEEIPFAGHPTLGTAYVIQREIIGEEAAVVGLNLGVGRIPVAITYVEGVVENLWMTQKAPTFGRAFEAKVVAGALNLDPRDIDTRYPVQEVSTGLPFIMVPLRKLDALKRAVVERKKYFELISDTDAKAIFIFCPETYNAENNIAARLFADYYGVPEDPATGSANGCLAGYLVKHRFYGSRMIDVRVEQGYEIGRPSLLYLKAQEVGKMIEVKVGGKVVMVAKGEFV